jgi:hypothetical protein
MTVLRSTEMFRKAGSLRPSSRTVVHNNSFMQVAVRDISPVFAASLFGAHMRRHGVIRWVTAGPLCHTTRRHTRSYLPRRHECQLSLSSTMTAIF